MAGGAPEKNSADWFPHLCGDSDSMFYLEKNYKEKGYTAWFKMLEDLCKKDFHFLDLSKEAAVMRLSAKCFLEEEMLIKIIIDLVRLGEFNKCLWEKKKVIFSQKLCDSLTELYKKRKNNCITLEELCDLLNNKCTRKLGLCTLYSSRNSQIRLDKIKEDNNNNSSNSKNTPKNNFYYSIEDFKLLLSINGKAKKPKDLDPNIEEILKRMGGWSKACDMDTFKLTNKFFSALKEIKEI